MSIEGDMSNLCAPVALNPDLSGRSAMYIAQWEYDLPGHSWRSARALIDQLLLLDISSEHMRQLENIRIQL